MTKMKNTMPFHAALLTITALAACLGCVATRKHVKSVSDPLDRRIGGLTAKAEELDNSTRASPVKNAALDLTTAEGLLERARREMGGTARLQSIVSFTQTLQRITPKFGGGTITGPKINERICRSQWRQEDRKNQRVVYFDGGPSVV